MKLLLFGAAGSGVTTLGNAISKRLRIPYFDCDDYYWELSNPPFTVKREPAARNALIRSEMEKYESFVTGGNIMSWGADVFPVFDLAVLIKLDPETRLNRLKARELQRYGDIIVTDPERSGLFNKFMAWAADYDNNTGISNRTLLAHEQWMTTLPFTVFTLTGNHSVEERMELILEKLCINHTG